MENPNTNLGREIQKVGKFIQSIGVIVHAAGMILEPYYNFLRQQRHLEQCIRVLRIKRMTLGLTYFEKQRLKLLENSNNL